MKFEMIFTAVAFVLLSLIARYSQSADDIRSKEIVKPQSLSTSLPQNQADTAISVSLPQPLTK